MTKELRNEAIKDLWFLIWNGGIFIICALFLLWQVFSIVTTPKNPNEWHCIGICSGPASGDSK